MARYDEVRVPRGTSHRWEVIVADDEQEETPEAPKLTAFDVRADHRVLGDVSDDDLRAVELVREGAQLTRYQEYLDLRDPARANFLAEGTEVVRPGQRLIARRGTAKHVWDELIRASRDIVTRRRRSA